MKHKNLIIYSSVLVLCLLASYFLNGSTIVTPFPYFSMSFKFGLTTVVSTIVAAILVRGESFEDRLISLPLSVLAFSSASVLPFVVFTGAYFAILKIENIKFLTYAILNLLALLIFKENLVVSNLIFALSALLIISYTKKITLLNVFLIFYFTLLDMNTVLQPLHSVIIPLCAILLLVLYRLGKTRNAINVLALSILFLSPSVILSVILTAYSLVGLSILFDKFKSYDEKVITSNITIATLAISMSLLSGQAVILPLIVILAVFVEYNRNKVEISNAV